MVFLSQISVAEPDSINSAIASRPAGSGFLFVAVARVVVGIAGRWFWLLDNLWLLFRRAVFVVIFLRGGAGSGPCRHPHLHPKLFLLFYYCSPPRSFSPR